MSAAKFVVWGVLLARAYPRAFWITVAVLLIIGTIGRLVAPDWPPQRSTADWERINDENAAALREMAKHSKYCWVRNDCEHRR